MMFWTSIVVIVVLAASSEGFSHGEVLTKGNRTIRRMYCHRPASQRAPMHLEPGCDGLCEPRSDGDQHFVIDVKVNESTYWIDGIDVTLRARDSSHYHVTGFTLYAIADSGEVVGDFDASDDVAVGSCAGILHNNVEGRFAVHMKARHGQRNITVTWKPDGYNHRTIKFVAWIVHDHSHVFRLESQQLASQKNGDQVLDIDVTFRELLGSVQATLTQFEEAFISRQTQGYHIELGDPFAPFNTDPTTDDLIPGLEDINIVENSPSDADNLLKILEQDLMPVRKEFAKETKALSGKRADGGDNTDDGKPRRSDQSLIVSALKSGKDKPYAEIPEGLHKPPVTADLQNTIPDDQINTKDKKHRGSNGQAVKETKWNNAFVTTEMPINLIHESIWSKSGNEPKKGSLEDARSNNSSSNRSNPAFSEDPLRKLIKNQGEINKENMAWPDTDTEFITAEQPPPLPLPTSSETLTTNGEIPTIIATGSPVTVVQDLYASNVLGANFMTTHNNNNDGMIDTEKNNSDTTYMEPANNSRDSDEVSEPLSIDNTESDKQTLVTQESIARPNLSNQTQIDPVNSVPSEQGAALMDNDQIKRQNKLLNISKIRIKRQSETSEDRPSRRGFKNTPPSWAHVSVADSPERSNGEVSLGPNPFLPSHLSMGLSSDNMGLPPAQGRGIPSPGGMGNMEGMGGRGMPQQNNRGMSFQGGTGGMESRGGMGGMGMPPQGNMRMQGNMGMSSQSQNGGQNSFQRNNMRMPPPGMFSQGNSMGMPQRSMNNGRMPTGNTPFMQNKGNNPMMANSFNPMMQQGQPPFSSNPAMGQSNQPQFGQSSGLTPQNGGFNQGQANGPQRPRSVPFPVPPNAQSSMLNSFGGSSGPGGFGSPSSPFPSGGLSSSPMGGQGPFGAQGNGSPFRMPSMQSQFGQQPMGPPGFQRGSSMGFGQQMNPRMGGSPGFNQPPNQFGGQFGNQQRMMPGGFGMSQGRSPMMNNMNGQMLPGMPSGFGPPGFNTGQGRGFPSSPFMSSMSSLRTGTPNSRFGVGMMNPFMLSSSSSSMSSSANPLIRAMMNRAPSSMGFPSSSMGFSGRGFPSMMSRGMPSMMGGRSPMMGMGGMGGLGGMGAMGGMRGRPGMSGRFPSVSMAGRSRG